MESEKKKVGNKSMEERVKDLEDTVRVMSERVENLRLKEKLGRLERKQKDEKEKDWKAKWEEAVMRIKRGYGWITERLINEEKKEIEEKKKDEIKKEDTIKVGSKQEEREQREPEVRDRKDRWLVIKKTIGWSFEVIYDWLRDKGMQRKAKIHKIEANDTKVMVEFESKEDRRRIWELRGEIWKERKFDVEEWYTFEERRCRGLLWLKAEEKIEKMVEERKRVSFKRGKDVIEINGKIYKLDSKGEMVEEKWEEEKYEEARKG